jgi:sugar phosphate isomerase/epimerase
MSMKTSRRIFIKSAGMGIAVSSYSAVFGSWSNQKQMTEKEGNERIKIGLASYTFKEFSLDDTISMTQRLGLKYIALKSFHLPLESTKDEIIAATGKVKAGGLDLYGCSVVVLKNENEVNQVFEYAKTAGMKMIIAQPESDMLEPVNKKVQEYNIMFAIHNHGPEDKNFPSPQVTYEKIKKLDSRIGLCIDVGHAKRSGIDPSECINKCADRLLDVHIKDLKTISSVADPVEVGRGKLDIPGILRTLLGINYSGVVSLEYEKDAKDPLPGVAESIGYIRGILSVI